MGLKEKRRISLLPTNIEREEAKEAKNSFALSSLHEALEVV